MVLWAAFAVGFTRILRRFQPALWRGLVAFGGYFDLVHDVVEDGLVDVEDAGA